MKLSRFVFALTLGLVAALPAWAGQRNVVIFVADGLRYDSVTPETAPTFAKVRREGVDFTNSHAAYPTMTTVNAAVIATGHYPGDTGNFANLLYVGAPIPCANGATIAFVENDCILRDLKTHFPNDYLAQTTLIEAAREAGMNTVIVGKHGPAAIQFLGALDSRGEDVGDPKGILIDDVTNRSAGSNGAPTGGTTLSDPLAAEILKATGENQPPPSSVPNVTQQTYLLAATTKVLLPRLKDSGKPFVLLFWSRDPDTTQHGATDSEGSLVPGINSVSGRAAIANADNNLKGILDALDQLGLRDNTDVFALADHGFSTIAKGIPTPDGALLQDSLPSGFLARDVAGWLGEKVFGSTVGPSPDAPTAIVTAGGGTDFIYVPENANRQAVAKRIFAKLLDAPYVGALFVGDDLLKGGDARNFAGALPLSEIGLIGSSNIPQPAIVVGFRSFVAKGCKLGREMCAVEIADTPLHTGQGMHGSFSRADTHNFMAAIGPDFKAGFVDTAPSGNADVAPTLAHILGVRLSGPGDLRGRVLSEALKSDKLPKTAKRTVVSATAAGGVRTVLDLQEVGHTRYFDAGGIPGRTVGLKGR